MREARSGFWSIKNWSNIVKEFLEIFLKWSILNWGKYSLTITTHSSNLTEHTLFSPRMRKTKTLVLTLNTGLYHKLTKAPTGPTTTITLRSNRTTYTVTCFFPNARKYSCEQTGADKFRIPNDNFDKYEITSVSEDHLTHIKQFSNVALEEVDEDEDAVDEDTDAADEEDADAGEKKQKTFTSRPRGRPPKDHTWCTETGQWIPAVAGDDDSDDSRTETDSDEDSLSHKPSAAGSRKGRSRTAVKLYSNLVPGYKNVTGERTSVQTDRFTYMVKGETGGEKKRWLERNQKNEKKKKKQKTFTQPCGRPPKDRTWCTETGQWIHAVANTTVVKKKTVVKNDGGLLDGVDYIEVSRPFVKMPGKGRPQNTAARLYAKKVVRTLSSH